MLPYSVVLIEKINLLYWNGHTVSLQIIIQEAETL